MDRIFLELQSDLEKCYRSLSNSIESVNVICSTYKDKKLGSIELIPNNCNVGFGSGLQSWAFTLETFAKMYSSKFGLSISSLVKRLWGNYYWNQKNCQWLKKNDNNQNVERSFCQFILKPIQTIFNSVMKEEKNIYEKIIQSLNLNININNLNNLKNKEIIKLIMRTWLPAGDILFNMIIDYLPSPIIAQKYRTEKLYSGPLDSNEAFDIQNCNPNGVMSMYISKMIPIKGKKKFKLSSFYCIW